MKKGLHFLPLLVGILLSFTSFAQGLCGYTLTPAITNASQGNCDGSINLNVTGGAQPLTFAWSNSQLTPNIVGLCMGNYKVSITDASACVDTFSYIITQQLSPCLLNITPAITNATQSMCDGSITLSISGGQPPYTYLWENSDTTKNRFGLCAGPYTVTITDGSACSEIINYNITHQVVDCPMVINLLSRTDASGSTICDGFIDISVDYFTPPLAYSWSRGDTTKMINNVCPGNYDLTVTDFLGCNKILNTYISFNQNPCQNFSASIFPYSVTDTIYPNGSINVNVNGTMPYQFHWADDSMQHSAYRSGLHTGLYEVTVIDAANCQTVLSTQVFYQAPDPCMYFYVNGQTHGVTDSTSNDGWINVTAGNGHLPYTFAWADDTSIHVASRTGLALGNYFVTVTDSLNCSKPQSFYVNIFNPCEGFYAYMNGKQNVSDTINPNGFIHIHAYGGHPPYSFLWNDGNTLQNREFMLVGSYSVTVTDSLNCPQVINEYLSFDSCGSFIISKTFGNVTDSAVNNGWMDVQASGGLMPYTYQWSHNPSLLGNHASDLGLGMYYVTVLDAKGCMKYENAYLIFQLPCQNFSAYPYAYNTTDTINPNGSISLNVNGAMPYHFVWADDTSLNIQNRNNLAAGTYYVTVTDANGCFAHLAPVVNFQIQNPCAGFFVTEQVQNASDSTAHDGWISLTAHNGVPLYHFAWADDSTGNMYGDYRANLGVGTYSVTVTDSQNCLFSKDYIIAVGSLNSASLLSVTPNTVHRGTMITVSISGQNTHFNQGTSTTQVWIQQGAQPSIWANSVYPINLQTLNAQFSIAPNLPLGMYNVYVSNATDGTLSIINGLYVSVDSINPAILSVSPSNVSLGQTMSVSISGQNTSFGQGTSTTQVWFQQGTTTTLNPSNINIISPTQLSVQLDIPSNQLPGFYDVFVNNSIDGSLMLGNALNVGQQNPCNLVYSIAKTDITCAGFMNGLATVTITNGIAPFSYAWSNGDQSETADSLSAGMYTVTINESTCWKVDTIFINEPPALSLTLSSIEPSCFGSHNGSVTSNVAGGKTPYQYLWLGGQETTQNLDSLPGGFYRLRVKDANNCIVEDSVSVATPAQLIVSAGSDQIACYNNTVQLEATGAMTYLWNNGTTSSQYSDTIFVSTTFVVTGTDVNGCTGIDSVFVQVVQPNSFNINATICEGGSYMMPDSSFVNTAGLHQLHFLSVNGCDSAYYVTLNITPLTIDTIFASICDGNTYSLPNNSVVTIAGDYPVVVQSIAGCDSTILTKLTVNATFNDTVNTTICAGTGYTLPNNTVVYASGTYPAHLQNNAGCDSTIVTIVIVNPSYTDTVNASICEGTSYSLPDNNVVSVAGVYSVSLTTMNGCDSTIVTNLTVNPSFTHTVNASICEGNGYTLPDNSIVTTSGNYSVTLTSFFGCDSTIVTDLIVNASYQDTLDAAICLGASYTLPDNSVVSQAGLYPFNDFTTNGCDSNLVINLIVNPLPVVNFTGLDPYYCVVDTFILLMGSHSTDGDFSGDGMVGGNIFNPANALVGLNTISYIYSDANGCTNSYTKTTTVNAIPELTSTTTDANCNQNNGSAILSAIGASPFTYSTGTATMSNLEAGTYEVTVTDVNGCKSSGFIAISNIGAPAVSINSQTDASCSVSCDGTTVLDVVGGAEPYAFTWSNGELLQNAVSLCPGESFVEVTDALGCIASTVVTLGFSQPDPTIYGRITYSGGGIDGQFAQLEIYSTSQHVGGGFDLMNADVQIGSDGSFIMANFPPDIYILKVNLIGNNPAYANLMNSYFRDTLSSFAWETADTIVLGCGHYKEANIVMHELFNNGTGTGLISGSITYPPTTGGKSIKGVSIAQGKLAGEPVPGAEIFVELEPDDQPIANTETDTNGFYAFEELPAGNYHMKVEIPGFPMLSTYAVAVSSTDTVFTDLNFYVDTASNDGTIDTALVYVKNEETPALSVSVYPNPYKDYLNISYSVLKAKDVSIEIYDITGRKIESVLNKLQNAGDYIYTFDPKKYSLKAGTYFVQLKVDNAIYLKKVVMNE